MSTYRYSTWGAREATVDAASVEFGPGHVIFRDAAGLVLLAEDNANVNRLTNDAAAGEATRRPRAPEATS